MSTKIKRILPNILITGTPGTGKTILAEEVAKKAGLKYVSIADTIKKKNLYDEWDERLNCYILDEDGLIDELDDIMNDGGIILDYHGCDLFPERWFDLIFVLRTNTEILYERLEKREYSAQKIKENIECEIFQTILEEAIESYDINIVHELQNNLIADLDRNAQKIVEKIGNCKK